MVSRPSVFSAGGLPFFIPLPAETIVYPSNSSSPHRRGMRVLLRPDDRQFNPSEACRRENSHRDRRRERLCKRYSLDDARRVVAEKARAEVYSVSVKADPGKAAMLHTAARGACESRRARTSPNISSASAISGRSTRLQRNTAVSAQERRHINSSTVTPGSQSCSATKLSISRGAPHRNSWRQQSRCSETPPTPSNTHAVGIKVTPRNSGTM